MPRITLAKAKVMVLAMTIGQALMRRPYISHNAIPTVKVLYIPKEMPLTFLVLKLCRACGTKLTVVKVAAA